MVSRGWGGAPASSWKLSRAVLSRPELVVRDTAMELSSNVSEDDSRMAKTRYWHLTGRDKVDINTIIDWPQARMIARGLWPSGISGNGKYAILFLRVKYMESEQGHCLTCIIKQTSKLQVSTSIMLATSVGKEGFFTQVPDLTLFSDPAPLVEEGGKSHWWNVL